MASMQRSIRRDIERRNGTFVAQRPLRDRNPVSFKQAFINSFFSAKRVSEAKTHKKLTFGQFVCNIFGRKIKEAN